MITSNSIVRAALLTPAGRGAVASIAVWGAGATAIVDERFRSATNRRLADKPPDSILYGRWATSGEEVVIARRKDGHVEIHCHGGIAASKAILADLAAHGCEVVDWKQRIEDVEAIPARACALVALADCATERTAAIVLDQYRGAFERAIEVSIELLKQSGPENALSQLRELVTWADLGRHLIHPWRVVIAGAPNVGKSTLVNALLGYRRAIVFDEPGTTRDVLTAATALDGWPVELVDTAGLRTSEQLIEKQGIARAKKEIDAADMVLLVFDATADWMVEEQTLAENSPNALFIFNKSDLLAGNALQAAVGRCGPNGLLASAKTGYNMTALTERIVSRLVPRAPWPGTAVPFTGQQVDGIETAIDCIQRGEHAVGVEALVRLVSRPGCK